MLSTTSRRPRIWVDPESAAPPPRFVVGRPLLRWIVWVVFVVIFAFLFGPFLLRSVDPEYYISPPYFPGHHKYRPPPPPHAHQPWIHAGLPPKSPSDTEPPILHDPKWAIRAAKVRDAFVHAYEGYRLYALPKDELEPVTGKGTDNFNGWGVTLFDALDTIWIMGLNDTFSDALEVIARSTFISPASSYDHFAPFFETVIRYLGGMLSAYALSGETILLTRANDLATLLLPAFNTTSGFPMYAVDTSNGQTRPGWNGQNVLWAEALSNQLELTCRVFRKDRAHNAPDVRAAAWRHLSVNVEHGDWAPCQQYALLNPVKIWLMTSIPADHFSVGAYADSAHEYLLKQWLLTNQSEPQTRDSYLRSMNAVIQNLLYLTPERNLLYVTDTYNSIPTHTLEHLSCFLPGLLALGVHTLDLSTKERELHSWAAEGLARTCWATYLDSETGLGPDEVQMLPGKWSNDGKGLWVEHVKEWERNGRSREGPPGTGKVERAEKGKERDYEAKKKSFLLRPEVEEDWSQTIESFYILWRTTGEEVWRERGWSVFEAIEKHARTEFGYASIIDVDQVPVNHKNEMPSYFLAETLKYLYLMFIDDDVLPLNEWVFNTEAHPLPIFKWRKWEKEKYGIPLIV
ncbi:hypothetical protein DXG01_000955 [Tephrocybe rancida]|nr:hypothetical protein DXG01_000955 [Tephrocybe rancida]